MERLNLQFVCFDTLGAHKGLEKLERVESIKPRDDETIDMNGLVERIATGDKSLIIDMTGCGLAKQQLLIADYCEALIDAKIGHNHNKTLMSIFEECQDYVPQQGNRYHTTLLCDCVSWVVDSATVAPSSHKDRLLVVRKQYHNPAFI